MQNNNSGCLSFLFPFLKLFKKSDGDIVLKNDIEQDDILQDNVNEVLPYGMRDDFLSVSENSFYNVLRQAIDDTIIICPKVGLKDIFFVKSRDRNDFAKYHNKIDRKHVDFLLCHAKTLKPICAIELDDSSHKKESRHIRDKFVNEVFEVSKLPLLRFENKRSYSLIEIKEKVNSVLHIKEENIIKVLELDIVGQTVPVCSKCGIDMVKRTITKGTNSGKKIYGCSNFPKCRETKDIIVESESV